MDEKQLKLLTKQISTYKDGALDYQQRRHDDWNWNYELYRDRVQVDNITQRQSVSVPLMKETISTIFSQIDDSPDIIFEQRSDYPLEDFEGKKMIGYKNNQKEIMLNAYWRYDYERMRLDLIDAVDKKQCLIYGRSFNKLFVGPDKKFHAIVVNPKDFLVDRYVRSENLDTAHCASHIHIYKTLGEIQSDPRYDKDAVKKLTEQLKNADGLQKSNSNAENLSDRNKVMQAIGDTTADEPKLGETYVEISENYLRITDPLIVAENGCQSDGFCWYLVTLAENEFVLMAKPLKEVPGVRVNFLPFVSWACDVEADDFWSDGVADVVRPANRVLNAWFSQLVENRTLRNYGMQYYDATQAEFSPETFKPVPWGWYGLPGKPQDIVQKIDIPELSESLDEMQFVTNMIEKATAATNIVKGTGIKSDVPLGAYTMANQNAQSRMTSIAKYYREKWKDFARKWYMILEANASYMPSVMLYKKATSGKYIGKKVSPRDWKDKEGYEIKVTSSSEQDQQNLQQLQTLNFAAQSMPNNVYMRRLFVKKLVGMIHATPEEERQILDYEEQQLGMGNQVPGTQVQAADQMGMNQEQAQTELLKSKNAGAPDAVNAQALAAQNASKPQA